MTLTGQKFGLKWEIFGNYTFKKSKK